VARVDRPPPVWGVVAAVGVLFVNWIVDASILQQHRLGRCRLLGGIGLGWCCCVKQLIGSLFVGGCRLSSLCSFC
jgi:hypothetical protein